jgi:hypothetical protein
MYVCNCCFTVKHLGLYRYLRVPGIKPPPPVFGNPCAVNTPGGCKSTVKVLVLEGIILILVQLYCVASYYTAD